MRQNDVIIRELHPKHGSWENIHYNAVAFDGFFFCHNNICGAL